MQVLALIGAGLVSIVLIYGVAQIAGRLIQSFNKED